MAVSSINFFLMNYFLNQIPGNYNYFMFLFKCLLYFEVQYMRLFNLLVK